MRNAGDGGSRDRTPSATRAAAAESSRPAALRASADHSMTPDQKRHSAARKVSSAHASDLRDLRIPCSVTRIQIGIRSSRIRRILIDIDLIDPAIRIDRSDQISSSRSSIFWRIRSTQSDRIVSSTALQTTRWRSRRIAYALRAGAPGGRSRGRGDSGERTDARAWSPTVPLGSDPPWRLFPQLRRHRHQAAGMPPAPRAALMPPRARRRARVAAHPRIETRR